MRSVVFVIDLPFFDDLACLNEVGEEVLVQPLAAQGNGGPSGNEEGRALDDSCQKLRRREDDVNQRTKSGVDMVQPILSRDQLLRSLSVASRSLLKDALQLVELAENSALFRRDAKVDGCYFVERGALRVSVEDHTGGETWLAIVGSGDWVGELGLLDRNPRSATVTAMTACRLWRLPIKEFDSLCRIDIEFYRSMVRLICARLRSTNREVCDQRLGFQARLAQTMLKLAKAFGKALPDGQTMICYRIKQVHLAEITGASRENVNRQFKAWKTAGLCDKIDNYYCLRELRKWSVLGQGYSPSVAS